MFVFIGFDFGGFVAFVVWVVCFACLFLSGSGLSVLVASVLYGSFGCVLGLLVLFDLGL